jgi:hypothetical protein
MGGVVDTQSSRKKAVPGIKKEDSQESQFKTVSAAFLELFELLEEYAPSWYTEEHHNRAVAAQRILMKSRGAAAT